MNEQTNQAVSLHFSSQRELLIKSATFLIGVLGTIWLLVSGWKEEIASRKPIIQQVGIPFYFTNYIHTVVVVPTNTMPITNVVTQP